MLRTLLSLASFLALLLGGLTALAFAAAPPPKKDGDLTESVKGAEGLEEALRNLRAIMVTTPPLSPQEALKHFQTRPGLAVDLIDGEPAVRQPLYLTFDERGRMWVVQYQQYPFPAGLKVVSYDRYIRAKFDKVPPPPPEHFKGNDRITIHEDTNGDGSFDKRTTFVEGLNITTAALPGRGGVWVLNPPYLLFYPDKGRTDKAVARPEVHLSGFGLEDTHSVASSLTWGPDGWIYGAHGSTCTAKVKVEIEKETKTTDFLGQAIWRYHPETHAFEVYAEGGGNTFGVAFDEKGRVYSGTNWGKYRGLHYVQGGYYVKGWGKHGPLTNPYALGFFDHMPHVGNADRLIHTFTIYGGGTMPELAGQIIGVNALQRRLQVTRFERDRSTFKTVEEPFLLTTTDGRFRPVDVKPGPDGALYIADLYEPRINHVDPRDNWDRATGRIYRVRPKDYQPVAPFDLRKKSSKELVSLLDHPNQWYRETALRLLGDRKDASVVGLLKENLVRQGGQEALESLWALHQCGGFDESAALGCLSHRDPHVRRWAVRLVGDRKEATTRVAARLAEMAAEDRDPEVRSQLASSAKRLPAGAALPILTGLWGREEDASDPHLPLLTWWALEPRAETACADVLKVFENPDLWRRSMVRGVILERLMQRWGMAGGRDNLLACAQLLRLAPDSGTAEVLLGGLEKAFAGRSSGALPAALREEVTRAWTRGSGKTSLALGLRIGHAPSLEKALALAGDEKGDRAKRLECIRILGEIEQPTCVPVLLRVLRTSPAGQVRQEALQALQRYPDPIIAQTVLELDPAKLPEADGVRGAAYSLLASRPSWALVLLKQIDGKLTSRAVPQEVVQKLALHKDAEVAKLVAKHWGRVRGTTPLQKQQELTRLSKVLKGSKGNAGPGKEVFTKTCSKCHKLFGEGGDVGPELTGYERDNMMYWMENVVDPNAAIREEYTTFVIQTADGRTLTGIVAGQDKSTVTLKDQEGRLTRLAREGIEDLRASPVSIMPEGQMATLSDQQIRDLFAYLMKK